MNALRLAREEHGDGDRTALLLHGLGSNAAGWWRLAGDLAARHWAVVAPDLRGHGSSPKAGEYALAAYAADVAAIGGPFDLVLGHSLGAAVALLVAAADRGWARRLVLEDPALHLEDIGAAEAWLLDEFEVDISAAGIQRRHPDWARQDCVAKAAALEACGPEVIRRTLHDNPDWDVRSQLAVVAVPTHVIGADPDLGALVDAAAVAAASNDLVTYEMIPGGDHSIHRNAYEPFLAAVLRSVAPQPGR